MDENFIHSILSIERVTLLPYKTRSNDEIHQDRKIWDTNYRRYEDGIDKIDARVIAELPVQRIVRHFKTGKKRNTLFFGTSMNQAQTL